MIYKENYLNYFFRNDRPSKCNSPEMTNYQYAQSLTPKSKSLKRTNRTCIQENGIYRINVYSNKIPRLPKILSKTPVRLRENLRTFKLRFNPKQTYFHKPKLLTRVSPSYTLHQNNKAISPYMSSSDSEKAFKDICLGTED